MSRCDLNIVFDREDRTYQAGDRVSGNVEVQVNKDVKCKALKIEMFWQTHGRGNSSYEFLDEHIGSETGWAAGSMLRFPFSFTAPKMPMTYHGVYLNIDYYIKARADIPWAIDPKASEDFIVVPGEKSGHDYRNAVPEKSGIDKKWIVGGIVAFVLLGILAVHWWLSVILATAVGIAALMKHMANRRLGKVEVNIRDTFVSPGGDIFVEVSLSPAKPIMLNKIYATLRGVETCVSGSGTNRTTHNHVLHEESLIFAENCQAPGGHAPVMKSGKLTLPGTGAYTFKARDNSIEWELEVYVDIPKYLDWKNTYDLTVVPG